MNAPLLSPSPPRRPLRKLFFGLLSTVVIVVAAAPTLISNIPALRDWLVRTVVGPINGDVSIGRLDAGWFRSIVLADVKLTPKSGEPALTIDRIESDRPFWQMILSPADMGTIRIERPVAFLEFRDKGTNWSELFRKPLDDTGKKIPSTKLRLDLGVRAQIVNGVLRGRSRHTGEDWQIDGLNLALGLRAASRGMSGSPEMFVEAGTPVDHREVSAGLCEDVLKFAAPAVARVAAAQGKFTIQLDDWRLPVDDPASGELGGRLTMHTVDVGPGPLTKSILGYVGMLLPGLNLPPTVQLARESTIPFQLIDRRVHHEHMRFSLLDLADVETSGFVGFDESLELTAVLGFHPPNPELRIAAVLRVLYSQPWPINIRGKLGAPIIDASPLKASVLNLSGKLIDDYELRPDSIGARVLRNLNISPQELRSLSGLIEQFAAPQPTLGVLPPPQPALPPPAPSGPMTNPPPLVNVPSPVPGATSSPTSPADAIGPAIVEGVGVAVDVLEAIRQRREAIRQQQLQNPPPPGVQNLPPEPTPRRPLLRQGLRMLLTPPPPAPSPTATQPALQP